MRDGMRFSSLDGAGVELARSVPGGRFYIFDAVTRQRCTGTTDSRGVFGHDGAACPLHGI